MQPRFTREPENGLWVVGLVASTGGLDALGQVLAPPPRPLPRRDGGPAAHPARAPSRLAEILGRRTALTVQPAHDGDRLRPGWSWWPHRAATP